MIITFGFLEHTSTLIRDYSEFLARSRNFPSLLTGNKSVQLSKTLLSHVTRFSFSSGIPSQQMKRLFKELLTNCYTVLAESLGHKV